MPRVVITGWKTGFSKVECTKTLQSACGFSLTDAKRVTDAILEGQTRIIDLQSEPEARTLVDRLEKLGAMAHVDTAL
jgi:ribosomal protein L7/L12